mmetsp:Transcript_2357/g.5094  ORF Transcript_2357/g.5094 Transcript_2357/m.5094 type:complete len:91 (+) Transcript_2357:102-374(+)
MNTGHHRNGSTVGKKIQTKGKMVPKSIDRRVFPIGKEDTPFRLTIPLPQAYNYPQRTPTPQIITLPIKHLNQEQAMTPSPPHQPQIPSYH